MSSDKSTMRSASDNIFTFFALYFTTLFSLDTWDAARGSPFRAPGENTYYRPAHPTPSPDSYQGGMFRSGGNGGGGARRDVGRVATARDSRAPIGMGATASCGACLM